jgi:ABC-type amino acid transport substrate-binding protein
MMKLYSKHLGVEYEFVETNWQNILADLTGKVVLPKNENDIEIKGENPVRGDIIATGFTVLPWRKKVVDFSHTTFPTGVWLICRSDSPLQPITPSNDIVKDIEAVKKKLSGVSVLALKNSCLDPDLYGMGNIGATVKLFPADRNLDEMIPAVLARMAESTLMDVPVALVALENSPGEIKVIGPISQPQEMACAVAKTSPNLLKSFNDFLHQCKKDGRYKSLMQKYYPSVFVYYPDFLKNN